MNSITQFFHHLLLGSSWDSLHDIFTDAICTTIYMVTMTLLIGGILGLILGIILYATAPDRLFSQKIVFLGANFLVNIIRPIPFIILVTACGPLSLHFLGTTIGTEAAIFVMVIGATMAIARIVEQNLVTIDPGLLDAARSMGASRLRTIWSVLIPETLANLVLGYTFLTIGVIDMSAMAGMIGGGGLGDYAIQYGYNQYNWHITITATVLIIIVVQLIQFMGNYFSRKLSRK